MKSLILCSVCVIVLIACASQEDSRTKVFKEYLRDTYGLAMEDNPVNYIVLPKDVGCSGCKKYTLNYLLQQKKYPNTVVICSEDIAASLPQDFPYRILIDSFGNIDKLNLKTQNVAIIATAHKHIDSIISTQPDNIESVLNSYFQNK